MNASADAAGGVGSYEFSFDWDDLVEPDSASVAFSSDGVFDLFLTDYSDLGSLPSVSAFTLDVLSEPNGSVISRIEGQSDDCSILGTDCFIVTNTSATSGANGLVEIAFRPDSVDPVLLGLASGSYLFTFGESFMPETGDATFEVRTSVVPVPASALLLFSSLLGLGAIRRRR